MSLFWFPTKPYIWKVSTANGMRTFRPYYEMKHLRHTITRS